MGEKIFLLPLAAIYYNIQDSVAKSKEYIVELNININIYIYLPWYNVQFRFQCMQQSMNQLSNTQRYTLTAGYEELR